MVSKQAAPPGAGAGAAVGSHDRGVQAFMYGIWVWVQQVFEKILRLVTKAIGGLNRYLGQVFAFFVFLILFLIIFGVIKIGNFSFGGSSSSREDAAYEEEETSEGKKKWYSNILPNISGIASPLGKKAYRSVPRDVEENGRCDNTRLVSVQDSKNRFSICMDATFKPPEPVRFTINPSNVSEFNALPNEIKKKIRNDTNKLTITVPYSYNEVPSAYVLDFTKATYADGTSAAYLFNDGDYDYWAFKAQNLDVTPGGTYAYEARSRPVKTDRNYNGLDGYL